MSRLALLRGSKRSFDGIGHRLACVVEVRNSFPRQGSEYFMRERIEGRLILSSATRARFRHSPIEEGGSGDRGDSDDQARSSLMLRVAYLDVSSCANAGTAVWQVIANRLVVDRQHIRNGLHDFSTRFGPNFKRLHIDAGMSSFTLNRASTVSILYSGIRVRWKRVGEEHFPVYLYNAFSRVSLKLSRYFRRVALRSPSKISSTKG